MNTDNVKLTWEKGVEERIRAQVTDKSTGKKPYMLALVGIPGSGKTTSSQVLVESLADVGCMLMPFDGYHFPLETLKTFPNAKDAVYRRGAFDTFDLQSLLRDLDRIRNGKETEVSLPGFDHAKGDPEEGAHVFRREDHKVVVCEGLYLLHNGDGWDKVADFFDFSVFVDADLDVCMDRLKIRNTVIPGYTPEEIDIRVDAVDRANSVTVQQSQDRADLIVSSAAT